MKTYKELSDTERRSIITQEYVVEKKSFADIAKKYNTYANKLRRDAIKFKVKIRDKSQAQKNALSTGKHQHPTKGKQRSQETKNKIGTMVLKSWENLDASELALRKKKSKEAWDSKTDEQKQNMQRAANEAVRVSSKVGSKLEKYLLERLIQDNIEVLFHQEQTLVNTKLQIDLYLPTMNLAIEVDGPSHDNPIWGNDALSKTKNYDQKKQGLIIGKGMKLLRIKQNMDFSPTRANIVYDRLVGVINTIKDNQSSDKYYEIKDV